MGADECLGLEELYDILISGPYVPLDVDVMEGRHHLLERFGPRRGLGKDVPKLGVGVFVNRSPRRDAEVAPHIGGVTEMKLFHFARGWLESVGRVLRGETDGDYVAVGGEPLLGLKVDFGVPLWVLCVSN